MSHPPEPQRHATPGAAPPWPGSSPHRTRLVWIPPPETEGELQAWFERVAAAEFARAIVVGDPPRAAARTWKTLDERGLATAVAEGLFPWREIHRKSPCARCLVVGSAEALGRFVAGAVGGSVDDVEWVLEPGHGAVVDVDARGIALRASNWPHARLTELG